MLLEILIPTYQRALLLRDNIVRLGDQILRHSLQDLVGIVISDNGSTDNTEEYVSALICDPNRSYALSYYRSPSNLGLEKNAVIVASKAKSKYILWCGDDDFIDDDYLPFVINSISRNSSIGCIIPGLSSLFSDGSVISSRNESFSELGLARGYRSVYAYSHLAHQMSGLVVIRSDTLNWYLRSPENRNPYLFIFFVAYALLNFDAIYAPRFKTLVSVSNKKDWSYNQVGLLDEVYKSYQILLGLLSSRQVADLMIRFMTMHSYRLSFRPLKPVRLLREMLILLSLPGSSPYLKFQTVLFFAKETLSLLRADSKCVTSGVA